MRFYKTTITLFVDPPVIAIFDDRLVYGIVKIHIHKKWMGISPLDGWFLGENIPCWKSPVGWSAWGYPQDDGTHQSSIFGWDLPWNGHHPSGDPTVETPTFFCVWKPLCCYHYENHHSSDSSSIHFFGYFLINPIDPLVNSYRTMENHHLMVSINGGSSKTDDL